MRKTIIIATLAAFGGFCLANMSAFAALRYNIWQSSGERFQLGYVIGYLDAVALAGQRDPRAQIPTGVGKNFDKWVRDVNAFYANPANQDRSVPDAMYQIGSKIRDQWLREWGTRQMGRPIASPSAVP